MLNECVTDDSRIHVTLPICVGWLVPTGKTSPYFTLGGAVMSGRSAGVPSALKRYGGEKIWASLCVSSGLLSVPLLGGLYSPPPALSTVASGSRTAVEW